MAGPKHSAQRLRALDAVRGFSVLSMTAFHATYDVAYVFHAGARWFRPPLQDVWRASIAWTFLFVAGFMCNLSQSNVRRAERYLLVALAVFVATSVAKVDTPISFGVIFCMGASTLVYEALKRAGVAEGGGGRADGAMALLLFGGFLLTRGVPSGQVGLGGAVVRLPRQPYDSGMLDWLGFPSPAFASGDYYPLIPFTLLFLSGARVGRLCLRHERVVAFLSGHGCAPLEWVGRHALALYVAHQPLIVGALTLALALGGG